MSIRYFAIVSLSRDKFGQILFQRRFPTVEKRFKTATKEDYVPISTSFIQSLIENNGLSPGSAALLDCRQLMKLFQQQPVYDVTTETGTIWPVLVFIRNELFFVTVVAVSHDELQRRHLESMVSVSTALNLMAGVWELMAPVPANMDASHPLLDELGRCLSVTCPYGEPMDFSLKRAAKVISHVAKTPPQAVVPAWRVPSSKAKNQVQFVVREMIQCVQYDRMDQHDEWELYGVVDCVADVDGPMPEVTASLTNTDDMAAISSYILHPLVTSHEHVTSKGGHDLVTLNVLPASEPFPLMFYQIKMPELPLWGSYRFKTVSDKEATLNLKLKLNERVRNSFEFFEVFFPFDVLGTINHVDFEISQGGMTFEKKSIHWNLGQKFPKQLEANAKATVKFAAHPGGEERHRVCANVIFKVDDYTFSTYEIDVKGVKIAQGKVKAKCICTRQLTSVDYKIHNGDDTNHYVTFPKVISSQ